MDTFPQSSNIYQIYTVITELPIYNYAADKLDYNVEKYGQTQVVEALRKAKERGKTNWPYIEAILRNSQTQQICKEQEKEEAYALFLESES